MQLPIFNAKGKEIGQADLPSEIFEQEINKGLMHQAYVRQMANARQSPAHVKTRGEVDLTKAKWYRQKGTGRARHGSRSAGIFVGGGKAFGPRNTRNYELQMPRKMRRAALRSALSALARDNQIVVVEDLNLDENKTRVMEQMLQTVAGTANVLVLYTQDQKEAVRSIYNLGDATALHVGYLNIRDLLKHDKVVIPVAALDAIKAHLG